MTTRLGRTRAPLRPRCAAGLPRPRHPRPVHDAAADARREGGDAPATAETASTAPTSAPSPIPVATTSVVVVDDDAMRRGLLRHLLQRSGRFAVVAEAADGLAGVAAVQAHEPEVVLLDLVMPVAGGRSVLPSIAAASPGSMVVLVSSLDPGPRVDTLFDAGAFAYLHASLLGPDFTAELDALLARWRGPRDAWGPVASRVRR